MRRILFALIVATLVAALGAAPRLVLPITTSLVRIASRVGIAPTSGATIAHALGAIDGHAYTNSREAFEASYAAGFRSFEVDLMTAGDGTIVAAHDAGALTAEFGLAAPVAGITGATFQAQRYYGRFHPLTLEELLELLEHHPDAQLVLDLKDRAGDPAANFAAMQRSIVATTTARDPRLLERMLPYAFAPEQLDALAAYPHIVYTLYRADAATPAVLRVVDSEPRIMAVEFGTEQFDPGLMLGLQRRGVGAIAHTVNDPDEAAALRWLGVASVITDVLR